MVQFTCPGCGDLVTCMGSATEKVKRCPRCAVPLKFYAPEGTLILDAENLTSAKVARKRIPHPGEVVEEEQCQGLRPEPTGATPIPQPEMPDTTRIEALEVRVLELEGCVELQGLAAQKMTAAIEALEGKEQITQYFCVRCGGKTLIPTSSLCDQCLKQGWRSDSSISQGYK